MTSDARPLDGVRIVVTRAKDQASSLVDQLESLGADCVAIATIAIVDPTDGGEARDHAVQGLASYDQLVVTSPNGARVLAASAQSQTAIPPVACVGPSTAGVLTDAGLNVNIVPDRAVAEGLLAVMPTPPDDNKRLLLFQAEVARDVLGDGLSKLGWNVDRVAAYRTVDAEISADDATAAASADVITFTSSSTVERFIRLVGADFLPPIVASIGPITSATAVEQGLIVDIEAEQHTILGLVEALVAWAEP